MAGGSFGPTGVAKERAEQYQGKVTSYVIIACLVAAIGGAIFGYDIGVSGLESIYNLKHCVKMGHEILSFCLYRRSHING